MARCFRECPQSPRLTGNSSRTSTVDRVRKKSRNASEPERREPDPGVPGRREPEREPERREPERRGPKPRAPDRRVPARCESESEPERREPERRGPGRREPDRCEPERRDPSRREPDRREPGRRESDPRELVPREPDRRLGQQRKFRQNFFEPNSLPTSSGTTLGGISQAENLELLTYWFNPAALIQLRKQFEDGGLREQERKITYALKRREAELSWAWGTSRTFLHREGTRAILWSSDSILANLASFTLNKVFFDWTCQYGMSPG
jgi:hypothetical protein